MRHTYIYIVGLTLFLYACSQKTTDVIQDTKPMEKAEEMMDKGDDMMDKDPEAFRATAPTPSAAPTINIGEAETFDLDNGLKVIVVENHKIPQVSFQLRLINDPIAERDKVGYASMASTIIRRGTESMTKAEIDEAADFIGGSVSSNQGGIFATALTKHQDKILGLMTDVLYNPSFPEEELGKIKTQTLSGLESQKTEPNSIASNIRAKVLYGDRHPYGEIQTPEDVENITMDDLKKYYNRFYVPSNAYLIMVGDIDRAGAKSIANEYFGEWEGSMPKRPARRVHPEKSDCQVSFAHKDGAVQSVINVASAFKLRPGEPDVIPASVMNSLLGGGFSSRLNQNLREDKAFTYGSGSSFRADPVTASFNASASTRSEVTDSSLVEILYELNRLRTEKVDEQELTSMKNFMTGGFARSLESPQTIAGFAYNIARYNLPSDYYQKYLKRLNAVSSQDIMDMANKYLNPETMSIVVVGNKDEVADKLKTFDDDGEITFYDAFANVMEVSDTPLPTNVTGGQVIEKYISAIGGTDKIAAITNLYTKSTTSMMGQDMIIEQYKKDGTKSAMKMGNGSMVFQEQKFDGTQMVISQMGQEQVMTEGPPVEDARRGAHIVEQANYVKEGLDIELKSLENINGSDAYRVAVMFPGGKTKTEYYDVASGLLVRSSETAPGPQGEVVITSDYSDYQSVSGVLMPHAVSVSGMLPGGAAMNLKVEEASANIDMEDAIFMK